MTAYTGPDTWLDMILATNSMHMMWKVHLKLPELMNNVSDEKEIDQVIDKVVSDMLQMQLFAIS